MATQTTLHTIEAVAEVLHARHRLFPAEGTCDTCKLTAAAIGKEFHIAAAPPPPVGEDDLAGIIRHCLDHAESWDDLHELGGWIATEIQKSGILQPPTNYSDTLTLHGVAIGELEGRWNEQAGINMRLARRLDRHDAALASLTARLDDACQAIAGKAGAGELAELRELVNQHDMSIDLLNGVCICGAAETCSCGNGVEPVRHTPPEAAPQAVTPADKLRAMSRQGGRPWMDGAPPNPETERISRIMESTSESDYPAAQDAKSREAARLNALHERRMRDFERLVIAEAEAASEAGEDEKWKAVGDAAREQWIKDQVYDQDGWPPVGKAAVAKAHELGLTPAPALVVTSGMVGSAAAAYVEAANNMPHSQGVRAILEHAAASWNKERQP